MGIMEWINMTQYMGRWRPVVNAIMDFCVPYNVRNLLTS
jgi:hypothetical protein